MQRSPEACVIAEFAAVHLERGGTSLENWEAFCVDYELDIYIVDEHDGIVHKSSFAELMSEPSVNVLMARGSHFKQKLVSKQI